MIRDVAGRAPPISNGRESEQTLALGPYAAANKQYGPVAAGNLSLTLQMQLRRCAPGIVLFHLARRLREELSCQLEAAHPRDCAGCRSGFLTQSPKRFYQLRHWRPP